MAGKLPCHATDAREDPGYSPRNQRAAAMA